MTLDKIKAGDDKLMKALRMLKTGDTRKYKNYRGITPLHTIGKIYARIIERKQRQTVEQSFEDSQFGFRPGRGVTDEIFIIRQINVKVLREGKESYLYFTLIEKAFDLVKRENIWLTLLKIDKCWYITLITCHIYFFD